MKATCAINLHDVVTVSKAHLVRRIAKSLSVAPPIKVFGTYLCFVSSRDA